MIHIVVNGLKFLVKSNISVLEACKFLGINIPKFCYHESLSVAGNCRMCLVEIQKTPKPVASCAMPVISDMVFFTASPLVKKARENVLETLLINHPLDCPICDQGGECDLQDETKSFGLDFNRFFFNKRAVEDKDCGLVVKTIMTRCIHCTRCVRFSSEVAGVDFFGTINRGTYTEISNYTPKSFNSYISGNVIDLCPVGALTSKIYAFKARPWELKSVETLDLTDGAGTSIYFHFKESEILRVLPKINSDINGNWISDRIRFSFDSLKFSRLGSLFVKTELNTFKKVNWAYLLSKFSQIFKKNKVLFIINNEIDLKSAVLLKKLSYIKKNQIKIKTVDTFSKQKNLYLSWLFNKIVDINRSKICFLFFVNVHTENVVINTKIKTKVMQNNFSLINFGKVFNSTYLLNYTNISFENFVFFLEAKLNILSKLLVRFTNPVLIFGESLYKTFSNELFLNFFFKRIITNSILININLKSNTESTKLLNVSRISHLDLKKAVHVAYINLEDNLNTRNIFNKKGETFWFHAFGSVLASLSKYIIPVVNTIEEDNIFLNLEQRPQKTKKLFSTSNKLKSFSLFLIYFCDNYLNTEKLNYSYLVFNYMNECIDNKNLFKKLFTKFSTQVNISVFSLSSRFYVYSNQYPIKSLIEDFFLVNSFCKNSLNLNKFSINTRTLNKSFYLI